MFALNTSIITTEEWVTLGVVVPGDIVRTQNQSVTEVVSTTAIHTDKECYKIVFGSETITCSADQKWRCNGWTTLLTTETLAGYIARGRKLWIYGVFNWKHDILTITKTATVPVSGISVDATDGMYLIGQLLVPTFQY